MPQTLVYLIAKYNAALTHGTPLAMLKAHVAKFDRSLTGLLVPLLQPNKTSHLRRVVCAIRSQLKVESAGDPRLGQFFNDMSCQIFIYLDMSWDRLLLSSFGITVQVMTVSMPHENTANLRYSFYQFLSLHKFKASSLTSWCSGTSSIAISI